MANNSKALALLARAITDYWILETNSLGVNILSYLGASIINSLGWVAGIIPYC